MWYNSLIKKRNRDRCVSMKYDGLSMEERRNLLEFIASRKDNIDAVVAQLTMALGFRSKLFGSLYLRKSVALYYKLPRCFRGCLSNEIYPAVAAEFNTTVKRVEKDIRTAIQSAYDNGTLFRFNELTGVSFISESYCPTNSEFIACISTWLHIVIG